MRFQNLFVAAAVMLAAASSTQAAPITGSRSFSTDGITLNGTNDLNSAFSFNFTGNPLVITTATATGQLAAVLPDNTPGTISPTTIAFSGGGVGSTLTTPFSFSFPQGSVDVTGGSILTRGVSSSTGTRTVGFDLVGTLRFAGFDPTPGSVALSFTQAGGPGNAISGSGTFTATPQVAAVPAPPTAFALLTAVPLLGVIRRVCRKSAA